MVTSSRGASVTEICRVVGRREFRSWEQLSRNMREALTKSASRFMRQLAAEIEQRGFVTVKWSIGRAVPVYFAVERCLLLDHETADSIPVKLGKQKYWCPKGVICIAFRKKYPTDTQ